MTTYAQFVGHRIDDMGWAAKARDAIVVLACEQHDFKLLDVALAVRYPDGSLTLNSSPVPVHDQDSPDTGILRNSSRASRSGRRHSRRRPSTRCMPELVPV